MDKTHKRGTEGRSDAGAQPHIKIKIQQPGKVCYDGVFIGYVFLDNNKALEMAQRTVEEMNITTLQSFHSFLKLVVSPHMRTFYLDKINNQKNVSIKIYR